MFQENLENYINYLNIGKAFFNQDKNLKSYTK